MVSRSPVDVLVRLVVMSTLGYTVAVFTIVDQYIYEYDVGLSIVTSTIG